jgi:hypothetical protein
MRLLMDCWLQNQQWQKEKNLALNRFINIVFLVVSLTFLSSVCAGQEADLSRQIKVSIEKGSLQNALQTVSNSTGLRFAYRQSLLEGKTVEALTYSGTFDNLLATLLSNNQLCYTFQNKQIILHTNCLPKHFTISGTILEDSTLAPLPYVAVSLVGSNFSAIADQNGYFELEADFGKASSNRLLFSSMGYQRDSLVIVPGKCENLSVVMKPKSYPVPEVTVMFREFVTEKTGNTRDHDAGSLYLDTHGQQTALKIKPHRRKPGKLVSVEYYLSDEGNTEAPFRVRIYNADSSGKPGKDLIEDALVVKPKGQTGWYSINLENLDIEIPSDGLFVAIEGVFPDDINQYYNESDFIDLAHPDKKQNTTTLAYGQRIGYNRKCRKDTWHYSMSKVWFQLTEQSFGVMIAAVVTYVKDDKNERTENDD